MILLSFFDILALVLTFFLTVTIIIAINILTSIIIAMILIIAMIFFVIYSLFVIEIDVSAFIQIHFHIVILIIIVFNTVFDYLNFCTFLYWVRQDSYSLQKVPHSALEHYMTIKELLLSYKLSYLFNIYYITIELPYSRLVRVCRDFWLLADSKSSRFYTIIE